MKLKVIVFIVSLMIVTSCGSTTSNSSEQLLTAPAIDKEISNTTESEDTKISSFVNEIFVDDSYSADVMVVGLPNGISEKAERLTQQMQESLAEHMEWYTNMLGNLKEGEPLPYDERLGITEEEYSFFKSLNDYMNMIKQKEVTIQIEKDRGQVTVTNAESPVLKKFTFNNTKNTISTVLGDLEYSNEIVASEDQKVTGRWNGYSWRLEERNNKLLQISIGQLEGEGKGVIYIKLQEMGKESIEEILYF
ncbi:hypothetical protein [Cohnella sp. GCM10027633]|uniref:hypothetical protein n=1 Tax=unclassified Cohnella TaxID=2636738 RepID=UPI003640A7CF